MGYFEKSARRYHANTIYHLHKAQEKDSIREDRRAKQYNLNRTPIRLNYQHEALSIFQPDKPMRPGLDYMIGETHTPLNDLVGIDPRDFKDYIHKNDPSLVSRC